MVKSFDNFDFDVNKVDNPKLEQSKSVITSYIKNGLNASKTAKELGISTNTVHKLVNPEYLKSVPGMVEQLRKIIPEESLEDEFAFLRSYFKAQMLYDDRGNSQHRAQSIKAGEYFGKLLGIFKDKDDKGNVTNITNIFTDALVNVSKKRLERLKTIESALPATPQGDAPIIEEDR